jgi:hypothetical protein
MRNLIGVGLAVSAAIMVQPQARAAIGGEAEWCRIARAEGGRECIFHTLAQCAMSTERLNGGGCIENPYFRGSAAPATAGGVPAGLAHHPVHHKRHRDTGR